MTGSSTYDWSDAYLRTSSGAVQTVDGAIALDPTHPGTKQLIAYYVELYADYGFDYIKSDFLSHGALEGIHYDPNVTTGIQAYNQGMSNIVRQINGRMFMSESIAPLFPYQYGDSRRIACDAETSLISNTEYTLNSVTYGWWLGGLYPFNDPDDLVFYGYGATTNENQSRLISGAITGLFLDGDDVTTTNGQQAAQACLTNAAINAVARVGRTFTPVEGNTGTGAANIFVRQDGATWCIAVLNYTASAANETVSLSRVGLPSGTYVATNLWDGTTATVTGSFNVALNAKQSKLFRLAVVPPANLAWSSLGNTGTWDTGISANWLNESNNLPTVFIAGDLVSFNDTPGEPTAVTVSGTVAPGGITVNSTNNAFTISGGTISGSGGLVKEGPSALTITSAGNFTGTATITGGSVYAGNNSFDSVSGITVTNDATLDFGGGQIQGGQPVTVSGPGVNGEGALYNSYNYYPVETLNITLAGNTTFGGTARWDLTDGSISGPYTLTLAWQDPVDNNYAQWNAVSIGANIAGITLTNSNPAVIQTLGVTGMDTSFQNPATVLILCTNSQLYFYGGSWNGSLHLLSGSILQTAQAVANFTGSTITFENGAQFISSSFTGNQSVNSAITLNGIALLSISGHNISYTNVISGPGGLLIQQSAYEMILSAANTYSGPTIIGAGPEIALTGSGSISQSPLIFFGGSNPATLHLDVSGLANDTFSLAGGQTLAGMGDINGSLAVSAGATLSPGGTNTTLGITTGANPVGTLAANGSITLAGTTTIKLNGSTNDVVQAGGALTYGGTLNLVNISGSPLAAGNRFQAFHATSYSGSFANIVPATPGAGLAWDTSHLNSGILAVVAQPVIRNATLAGGQLVLSGTNGTANSTYYLLMATNLTTPLTNWMPVATNTFDASGNFIVTNTVNSANSQQFYLIK
jgi:hypothetical protein